MKEKKRINKITANLRFHTLFSAFYILPWFRCRGIVHSLASRFRCQSSNLVSLFGDYNDITDRTILADTNSMFKDINGYAISSYITRVS